MVAFSVKNAWQIVCASLFHLSAVFFALFLYTCCIQIPPSCFHFMLNCKSQRSILRPSVPFRVQAQISHCHIFHFFSPQFGSFQHYVHVSSEIFLFLLRFARDIPAGQPDIKIKILETWMFVKSQNSKCREKTKQLKSKLGQTKRSYHFKTTFFQLEKTLKKI